MEVRPNWSKMIQIALEVKSNKHVLKIFLYLYYYFSFNLQLISIYLRTWWSACGMWMWNVMLTQRDSKYFYICSVNEKKCAIKSVDQHGFWFFLQGICKNPSEYTNFYFRKFQNRLIGAPKSPQTSHFKAYEA